MFFKYCNSKIDKVVSDKNNGSDLFTRRLGSKFELDLDKNIYIRNESVHSEETCSCNDNGDGFPRYELQTRYHTFIGSRSTFDHKDNRVVGKVIDSQFIVPVKVAAKIVGGDYIENFIEVEKEKAEELLPGSIDKIISGEITDTSMGAIVAFTTCSVCNHKAYNEEEYCEHIAGGKNRKVTSGSGEDKLVYEVCHGVTFFEDSIIIPGKYGGLAGGSGADRDAKIQDLITADRHFQTELSNFMIKFYNSLGNNQKKEFETLLDRMEKEIK